MDMIMEIDYSNYSIDELINLRSELGNLIDRKTMEAYDTAVNKVLESLKEMAEKYPYEDALDYNGTVTWEELYEAVSNF